MTNDLSKSEMLEAVAEWAACAMDRREEYERLLESGRPNGMHDYEWLDIKDAAWKEIKSADAMLKASLKRLHDSEIKDKTV